MSMRSLMAVVCGLFAACVPSYGAAQEAAAPAGGTVKQIQVVADTAPDCSSLKSIVQSVTRGAATNDEKAIAIYNFLVLANYHRDYPDEPGHTSALKAINVYGWSLCGGLHTMQAALWREMGWKWRYVGWSDPGHTTVEAFYDGQWHYLDVFLKFYAWKPDPKAANGRTIASQADIKANPNLVLKDMALDEKRGVVYARAYTPQVDWMAPAFLVCGDDAPGVVKGVNHNSNAGSPTAWGVIKFEDGPKDPHQYNTDVNLAPGYSLTLTWDRIDGAWYWMNQKQAPVHGCPPSADSIDKDYRNSPAIGPILESYIKSGGNKRSYANGTLVFAPDLASEAFLAGLAGKQNVQLAGGKLAPAQAGKPASITVELQSPYVMTQASGSAGTAKAELSVDGGKTFQPVDLKEFSEAVRGKYRALVKLTFDEPLESLKLEAIVQCNRCALPYLSPGANKITVSALNPKNLGDNRLVVTYAYRLGWHDKSFEQIVAAGGRVGAGESATWSDVPTVVQKTFTAKDLPATFAIDVPTPKGKFPAYPRMVLLRREVLAPGQKPMPVPEGAVAAARGPDDELKTLPNPFLVGARWPDGAKAAAR